MEEFFRILSEEWAIRALLASSLVGITCGVIGTFMVLRNMSLIGDALSHAILPGIFVAFVLVGYSSVGFFTGTLAAALISAVGITWIQEKVRTKNDAAIGIIFTFMFSLGVIGISYLNNQQGVHLDLKDFLFGTILGVSDEDLLITAFVAIYSLASIIVFYRYLFVTTFQPTIAQTMGFSVRFMHYFLMLLLSFAVVAALRTVGIILVVAMLITPSATALLLSHRLKVVLVLSGLLGLFSAVSGFVVSVLLDTTPGPAMCVMATLLYFTAVFLSPSKGLIIQYYHKKKQEWQVQKEDIIKYIFKHPGKTPPLVSIAKQLNLSAKKVSGHLAQLRKDGILSGQRGSDFTLSAKGYEIAENLVRAHRLWETYLVDEAGYKEADIHEEAEKLEHLLRGDILDQLDARLGFPKTDPHGSPIPSKKVTANNPMLSLKPGNRAKISQDQINTEVLRALWNLGLTADSVIYILEIKPKMVKIRKGQKTFDIPAELANQINVY